ncbi:16S rRNA C967 or C1407 C5-methylase, RsmB/RsmF family [bacterium A37T11]|nr:16S rRNA C967 or C1407 C5-methylase, RsmB/RsmF family [bacterium A37T11]
MFAIMNTVFPASLLLELSEAYGIDGSLFLAAHEVSSQVTSIRINPAKGMSPEPHWESIPWCKQGYLLPKRPIFTTDPLFHAGCYYVQEPSSMFIDHIVRSLNLHQTALKALDLCAAPGGKSTLLNSALHPGSLILANELIKTRVTLLADNLTRWGYDNTVVSNNDPSAFSRLPGFFDLMLVDAPCSGSGMFRKDPHSMDEWSENTVNLCSQRQKRILSDSLIALKEGGILLYATCSFSTAENEEIADWICDLSGFENIRISCQPAWGIQETQSKIHHCYGYRFYPHLTTGEGFFISVFRKTSPQKSYQPATAKSRPRQPLTKVLIEWVTPGMAPTLLEMGDDLFMVPKNHLDSIQGLQKNLYLKKAGTKLGKTIRSEFIPHHELALSCHIHPSTPALPLELPSALEFLRKNELPVASNKKGWTLVTYQGHGLGWAKILANRINNYYPKEWRILHF